MKLRLLPLCTAVLAILALACSVRAGEDFTAVERKTIAAMALSALPPLAPDTTNRFADQPGPAAFGATLFFEQRLSRTGTVSCATCHRSDSQFQDDLPQAVGIGRTNRRTMPLAGVARNAWFFWDGRRDSLWAQALVPLENPLEHGGSRAFYAHVVAEKLKDRYEHVFGPLPDLSSVPRHAGPLGNVAERAAWAAMSAPQRDAVDTVFVNLGKALAAFERTIEPKPTRFDRFADSLAADVPTARDAILTSQEEAGLKLFIGKARCSSCHAGPRFTDGAFHNTGVLPVAGLPEDLGRATAVDQVLSDPFNCLGKFRDGDAGDCAALRSLSSTGPASTRAYKTPSLRGVATRAPYMHAGQFSTLGDVIDHYVNAPSTEGMSELRPLALLPVERAALVAFLQTLTD